MNGTTDLDKKEVRLEAVGLGDVAFLCAMANEPAIREIFCDGPTLPENWRAMVTSWKKDPDEENFIIVRNANGAGLGRSKRVVVRRKDRLAQDVRVAAGVLGPRIRDFSPSTDVQMAHFEGTERTALGQMKSISGPRRASPERVQGHRKKAILRRYAGNSSGKSLDGVQAIEGRSRRQKGDGSRFRGGTLSGQVLLVPDTYGGRRGEARIQLLGSSTEFVGPSRHKDDFAPQNQGLGRHPGKSRVCPQEKGGNGFWRPFPLRHTVEIPAGYPGRDVARPDPACRFTHRSLFSCPNRGTVKPNTPDIPEISPDAFFKPSLADRPGILGDSIETQKNRDHQNPNLT